MQHTKAARMKDTKHKKRQHTKDATHKRFNAQNASTKYAKTKYATKTDAVHRSATHTPYCRACLHMQQDVIFNQRLPQWTLVLETALSSVQSNFHQKPIQR